MNESLQQCATSEAEANDIEAEGLRDRLRVNESQIGQLEYAIDQLVKKLTPVLRPDLNDKKEAGCTAAPQPLRSPAAQAIHSQGERIFNAHRVLAAIDKRLAL